MPAYMAFVSNGAYRLQLASETPGAAQEVFDSLFRRLSSLALGLNRSYLARKEKCCIAHFLVVPVSHSTGGRLLPERKDPGQARIRIDALSAA